MPGFSEILPVDPVQPEADRMETAGRIIHKGGVIVFPTRSLYGLAADALNADAVNRLFDIKGRPRQKPILVLIHQREQLELLVKTVPVTARRIMEQFWPGRVTIVFEAQAGLPDNLTAGTGKIGVRLCGHPVAAALVQAARGPITGTSANLSGTPGCPSVSELPEEIRNSVDLILDGGRLKGGTGSTVVDVTGDRPVILREGSVSSQAVFSAAAGASGQFC